MRSHASVMLQKVQKGVFQKTINNLEQAALKNSLGVVSLVGLWLGVKKINKNSSS